MAPELNAPFFYFKRLLDQSTPSSMSAGIVVTGTVEECVLLPDWEADELPTGVQGHVDPGSTLRDAEAHLAQHRVTSCLGSRSGFGRREPSPWKACPSPSPFIRIVVGMAHSGPPALWEGGVELLRWHILAAAMQ